MIGVLREKEVVGVSNPARYALALSPNHARVSADTYCINTQQLLSP